VRVARSIIKRQFISAAAVTNATGDERTVLGSRVDHGLQRGEKVVPVLDHACLFHRVTRWMVHVSINTWDLKIVLHLPSVKTGVQYCKWTASS
jgi:hypothetical protein